MSTYKLVRYGINNLQLLENEVNELINQGWKPIGELKQAVSERIPIFIQQMSLVDKPKKCCSKLESPGAPIVMIDEHEYYND